MEFCNTIFRAAIVGIPQRSWKWGHRAELRIRRSTDDRPLKGRGYRQGLLFCREVDARYLGPRSKLGKLLQEFDLR
jgi:hypothetical protein